MLTAQLAAGGVKIDGYTVALAAIALTIYVMLSAVIFRSACHYAKVKEPDYLKACMIVLVTVFAVGVPSFLIGTAFTLALGHSTQTQVMANMLAQPLGILISIWVVKAMLPTKKWSSAAIIYGIQILIWVIIAIIGWVISLIVGAMM